MKINRFHFLLVIFLTVVVILVYFTNSNAETVFTDDGNNTKVIETLLKKRVNIINDYFFNDATYLNVKERLSSIEMEKLLREDLEILKEVEENPTDFPYVRDISIESIKLREENEVRLGYTVLIRWDIFYNEVNILEKECYEVNLIKNNKLYLTKFQHIRTIE